MKGTLMTAIQRVAQGLMVVLGLLTIVALAASPASAAAPEQWTETTTWPESVFADCGDFTVIAAASGTANVSVFSDRDGNPVRMDLHITEYGSMTNSVTGERITTRNHIQSSIDLIDGYQTLVGTLFNANGRSAGDVLLSAGHVVMAPDHTDAAANGRLDLSPTNTAAVCEVLG